MIYAGIHKVKIDGKGRFSIPAAFRQGKEGEVRFLEHPDSPVLIGHIPDDLSDEMASLSTIFSKVVKYKQDGRAVLPLEFRKFVGLKESDDDITIIGMGNNFQIWSAENWSKVEPAYKERLAKALVKESVWVPPTADKNS